MGGRYSVLSKVILLRILQCTTPHRTFHSQFDSWAKLSNGDIEMVISHVNYGSGGMPDWTRVVLHMRAVRRTP